VEKPSWEVKRQIWTRLRMNAEVLCFPLSQLSLATIFFSFWIWSHGLVLSCLLLELVAVRVYASLLFHVFSAFTCSFSFSVVSAFSRDLQISSRLDSFSDEQGDSSNQMFLVLSQ